VTPLQTSTTSERPASASTSAAQIRRRTCCFSTAHAHRAIRIGAMYSMSSAIPIGSRSIETK
jgi:hypothetical protein